jgi:hypothetical protein
MKAGAIVLSSLLGCTWVAQCIEPQSPPQLSLVNRIFVDQLGGGHTSDQMRDMIVAALQKSGLFIITENPDRADATLRGSADDKIYTEEHNLSESLGLRSSGASGSGTSSSMSGTTSSHKSTGIGITDSENSHIEERRHETSASIHLVDANGDVIWSTTQESAGGKFRGAMADVADKIANELIADTLKARAARIAAAAASARQSESQSTK